MEKTDRTVVRNQPYQRGRIGIRERYNERKPFATYSNGRRRRKDSERPGNNPATGSGAP